MLLPESKYGGCRERHDHGHASDPDRSRSVATRCLLGVPSERQSFTILNPLAFRKRRDKALRAPAFGALVDAMYKARLAA